MERPENPHDVSSADWMKRATRQLRATPGRGPLASVRMFAASEKDESALYAVLSGRGGDPRGVWLSRQPNAPADPVFPSARGGRLGADAVPATRRSTHGDRMSGLRVAQREDRHASQPAARRGHGAAPARRRPDGNRAVARATNQRSRQRCTCHADMRLKERALAHATASGLVPDRYRAPDPLLAFLDALSFLRGWTRHSRVGC